VGEGVDMMAGWNDCCPGERYCGGPGAGPGYINLGSPPKLMKALVAQSATCLSTMACEVARTRAVAVACSGP